MSVETFYDKVDTQGCLAVGATGIVAANMNSDGSVYLCRDMGAGGIAGDFEHTLETSLTAYTGALAFGGIWGLANAKQKYFFGDSSVLYWWNMGGDLVLVLAGDGLFDYSVALSLSTTYYITITRIVPTTIYCVIYSDAARTVVVDTLTPPLADGIDFRYVYTGYNYDTDESGLKMSFTVDNLDLGLWKDTVAEIAPLSGDGRSL